MGAGKRQKIVPYVKVFLTQSWFEGECMDEGREYIAIRQAGVRSGGPMK